MPIDEYRGPDAEALLLTGEERLARRQRERREILVHSLGAASFLAAAALLAALAPWGERLSVTSLVLVLVTWVAVERVKFAVASGWARPTMLAFVPMLFMLPTPIVPLIAMVAILLGQSVAIIRGRTRLAMIPAFIGDAWFTIGPALVIVLGGAQLFSWSHWPIYVAALVAQILFDLAASTMIPWFAERIDPRPQLPLMAWIYAVDAMLAPLGLVVAAVAVDRPGLVLLTLPVVGLFALFARERQQRLDAILELSTAYRGTTLLLGDIIEGDDAYTGMHSRQVVDLALGVADALALDAAQKRNVEFGALLHDVGKIRVPKEILNKNGPLDPLEWEFIRRHTIEGEAMVRQVGGKLAELGPIIRASHERWDGDGYPDRIAADQIPIEARIISACDAFNAMTTDRPYRSAMDRAEALEELRRCAGGQFDPQVVDALDRLITGELAAATSPLRAARAEGLREQNASRTPETQVYTALSARL